MRVIYYISLLISFFQIIKISKQNQTFFKCGANDEKIAPIIATNYIEIDEDKRKLDDDNNFKNFHIYLDLVNIKQDIIKYHLEKNEQLIINSLTKAVNALESLLKVKKPKYAYLFSDDNIQKIGIDFWNETMLGSNAIGNTYTLDMDLIIFGKFDNEMDSSILASAGARYLNSDMRPIMGLVFINTNIDFSKINSQEYFQSIIIHEFTHILGFSNYFFTEYFHNIFNKKDSYNIQRYYINSTKVINVAKKYFNCENLEGVELEESGGGGTASSHWESRILLGEYMNGVIYPEEQVISEFTLALLEDMGFYKVNYYTGGLMRYGKGKGCDFIKNRCVNDTHEINPKFENEFYDSIESPYLFDASCSSGRQSRTYFAWWVYNNIPKYYQYFTNKKYGGFSAADYCPVAKGYRQENINAYYTGHCSKKGNGKYGSQIKYFNGQENTAVSYLSEELYDLTGETYSDHSFCYQTTLIKNSTGYDGLDVVRAVCYESFCSDYSLTVKINQDYIVCPRAGGKIEIEGYFGFFLCPDYNLICSGTIICNDMFDCISKKSEIINNSYIYDYEIKTSQNIENITTTSPDTETNYEKGENGICPINCSHCHINNTCIKCRNGFGLIGSNDNHETHCISLDKLNTGYYQNNNVYYPCMDFCDICFNYTSCNNCSEGYDYFNGKCILQIKNCREYLNESLCDKCDDNFTFNEDNRSVCLSKENFTGDYYTKDNGISYYPCDNEIENCDKCYYDNQLNKTRCYLCISNFLIILNNETCISKNQMNKSYIYINETHINQCSNIIKNCDECDNNQTCLKCIHDFYMINNKTNICINISLIPLDEYYLNDNRTIYYSCNNNNYQNIKNCKKCISKDNCTLCQDNFTFIDGNKSICIEKEKLNDKYIQDPLDNSNFIKCGKVYDNCDKCNSIQCLSCEKEYIFINDNFSKCVLKSFIDLEYYFTNDNITYYSCEEEKYKNKEECKIIISEIIKNPEASISNINYIETNINQINNTLTEYPIESYINQINNTFTENTSKIYINQKNNNFTDYPIEIHINQINNTYTEYPKDISLNQTNNTFIENTTQIYIIPTINDYTESVNEIKISLTEYSNTDMINSRNNMHNPFFELFILQVRIIDKLFKIYAYLFIYFKLLK